MAFKITTTGIQTPVSFDDLGDRQYTHPTSGYDLLLEFKQEEVRDSLDVQAAIDNNWITVEDEFGNPISETSAAVTHSGLALLDQDDHEQYAMTDGTSRTIFHVNDPVLNEVLRYDDNIDKWVNSSGGAAGTSGTSGTSGATGTSGSSGTSGIDGTSGSSGTSGIDGTSGSSGTSGATGTSGSSGSSGSSGTSGATGTSGSSGSSGTSGATGTSGSSGTSGIDGTSGSSGSSGTSGSSGSSGTSGATPRGAMYFLHDETSASNFLLSRDPGDIPEVIITETNITSEVLIGTWDTITGDPDLEIMPAGIWEAKFYAAVSNAAGYTNLKFKVFKLEPGGATTLLAEGDSPDINSTTPALYTWDITQNVPVDFDTDDMIRLEVYVDSTSNIDLDFYYEGTTRSSNLTTPIFMGGAGTSGTSGTSGSGTSGTSGVAGTSGSSGTSGVSGTSGSSGTSGVSGTSGSSGTSGVSGTSGSSGTSGATGTSGSSGTSGVSGTSGSSGTSGATGTSGSSGTSGAAGTSGTSASGVHYDSTSNEVIYFDEDRSKNLSVSLINFGASRDSVSTTNQYLRTYDGAPTNLNGFTLPFDATLVAISISGQASQTWTAEIRKNDAVAVIDSLTMTASQENHDYTKDTDFNEGDRIQLYCNGTSIDRPLIEVFFRRRI